MANSMAGYENRITRKSQGHTEVTDFFEVDAHEKWDSEYGSTSRLMQHGFIKLDSGEIVLDPEFKDTFETNIQKSLNMLTVNSLRIKEYRNLVPLYSAIQSVLERSAIKYDKSYKNVLDYFRVYFEAHVFEERQILENHEKMEQWLNIFNAISSRSLVSFRLFSGVKNYLANYPKIFADTLSKSMFYGKANMSQLLSSCVEGMKVADMRDKGQALKFNSIMKTVSVIDVGPDSIASNKLTAKGHKTFGDMGYLQNTIADYTLRGTLMVGRMKYDGVWDSYDKVTDEYGIDVYIYNEDKDPRFKSEYGIKLKEAIKEQMRLEDAGTLTDEDRMITPYTASEIIRMNKEANLIGDVMNSEDKANYVQLTFGRLLGSMNGWAASFGDNLNTRTQMNPHFVDFVTIPVIDENGEVIGGQPLFRGAGMFEGMFQTLRAMSEHLYIAVKEKDFKTFQLRYNALEPIEKQNLLKFSHNFIAMGLLAGIIAAAFDDEDKDTILYRTILMGSLNESFFLMQMKSILDSVRSPVPAMAVAYNTFNALIGGNIEKTGLSLIQFTPAKMVTDVMRFNREVEEMTK